MDDLKMTKLCAEAMGLSVQMQGDYLRYQDEVFADIWLIYDPLHDDAQAMALVKRLPVSIFRTGDNVRDGTYRVICGWREADDVYREWDAWNPNLNRAIVECVAKMQAARTTESPVRSPDNATAN